MNLWQTHTNSIQSINPSNCLCIFVIPLASYLRYQSPYLGYFIDTNHNKWGSRTGTTNQSEKNCKQAHGIISLILVYLSYPAAKGYIIELLRWVCMLCFMLFPNHGIWWTATFLVRLACANGFSVAKLAVLGSLTLWWFTIATKAMAHVVWFMIIFTTFNHQMVPSDKLT